MSRNFTGVDTDYLDFSTVYAFDEGSAFSVGCMCKLSNLGVDKKTILCQFELNGSDRRPFRFYVDSDGTVVLKTDNNTAITTSALTVDTWYTIVLTSDGTGNSSGATIYIYEVATGTQFGTWSNTPSFSMTQTTAIPVFCGASYNFLTGNATQDNFYGDIAHIFLLDSEIATAAEIALFNDDPVTEFANWEIAYTPVFYHKLDDVTPGLDDSSAGNAVTVNGTTFTADAPYLGYAIPSSTHSILLSEEVESPSLGYAAGFTYTKDKGEVGEEIATVGNGGVIAITTTPSDTLRHLVSFPIAGEPVAGQTIEVDYDAASGDIRGTAAGNIALATANKGGTNCED